MKKSYVIKKAWEFEEIINKGTCKRNRSFVIHSLKNNLPYDKYGISVSKKLGNAVFRNKYKRKIRTIIDNYKKNYINGTDYIIILRRGALEKSHKELEKDFLDLMPKIERNKLWRKTK